MSNSQNTSAPTPVWLICSKCGRDYQIIPRRFTDLIELHRRDHLCTACQRREQRKAA